MLTMNLLFKQTTAARPFIITLNNASIVFICKQITHQVKVEPFHQICYKLAANRSDKCLINIWIIRNYANSMSRCQLSIGV